MVFSNLAAVSVYGILIFIAGVWGHGMMLDPPNRSSVWRFDPSAPINYDDNQNFCGGYSVQWNQYGGKCGVCGDSYGDPHPQDNENTGKYGQGIVVGEYLEGSAINISVLLTSNHKGFFNYSLCILEDSTAPEQEECFFDLTLQDGSTKYPVSSGVNNFEHSLLLPEGIVCDRCVLRWTYTTGNNWGVCEDGTGALGCGPQETFRDCADIAIYQYDE